MSLRDAAAPSNKSNESVMNVVQSNFKKVAGEGADAVEVQQSVSLRGEGGRLLFWRPFGLNIGLTSDGQKWGGLFSRPKNGAG